MTKPSDKRRTSKSGLPAGVEIHGDTFRKGVMVDGKRVAFTHLPGCLEWTHAVELLRLLRGRPRGGQARAPDPGEAVGARRRTTRGGSSAAACPTSSTPSRWSCRGGRPPGQLDKLQRSSTARRLLTHARAAAPSGPGANWTQLPIDRIDFVEVEQWVLRRKAELIADQRRIQDGRAGAGAARQGRVAAASATGHVKQGMPGVNADREAAAHAARAVPGRAQQGPVGTDRAAAAELGRRSTSPCGSRRRCSTRRSRTPASSASTVNPLAALKTGWYGRDTGIVRRKTNKRKPAEPDDIRRIAARLHPAHRLPLWLGVIMALRIGEIFGLPVRLWDPVNKVIHIEQQFGRWRESEGGPLRYLKPWTKTRRRRPTCGCRTPWPT